MDLNEALYEARRTFSPPRELGSAPRDVRLTPGGRTFVVAIVLLFVGSAVAGLAMQHQVAQETIERNMFAETGITTDAEVTRLWRTSGESKKNWIAYRFEAGSRAYEGQTRVSSSLWRALQAGSIVSVRYLQDDPNRSTLASGAPGGLPFWLPYLMATIVASGGVLCLWMLMRQRSLLADGRAAPAVVTKVIVHKTGHGTNRSIRYAFPLMSGATATGKSGTSRKPPAAGSVICVIYLPDEPGRSSPYPLSFVRPAAR